MLGIRPLLQVPPRDLPVGEVIDDERGDLTLARRHASSAPECLPGSSGSSSRTVTNAPPHEAGGSNTRGAGLRPPRNSTSALREKPGCRAAARSVRRPFSGRPAVAGVDDVRRLDLLSAIPTPNGSVLLAYRVP
jgi:hypothetical protein